MGNDMMRVRVGMVVVVAVAALAAACGSSTTYSGTSASTGGRLVVTDPAAVVAASAGATTSARSARISGTATMTISGLAKRLSFSIDGIVSLDGRRGAVKMDLSSVLGMIPGAPAKLIVEERVVDGVVYMNFGDLLAAVSGGRQQAPPSMRNIKWLSLDVSALQGTKGVGSSPGSFTQALEYLRGATGGNVTEVGREQVRGVATTHYSARITTAQIEQQLRAAAGRSELAKQALEGIGALGDGVTVDVWIDGERLVRRERIGFAFGVGAQRASMQMTIDLFDFGAPVDVRPPPANQVRPFTDLARISAGA